MTMLVQYMPIFSQLRKQNSSLKKGNSPPTWLFTYLAQTVPLNAKDYAICCVYKLRKRERGPALTNVHPKRGTDNQQANNPSDAVKSLDQLLFNRVSGLACIPYDLCKPHTFWTVASSLISPYISVHFSFVEDRLGIHSICFQTYLYFCVLLKFLPCN